MKTKSANEAKAAKLFILTGRFLYGGTEKFLFGLIQNLDKSKFDVFVGCYQSGGPFLPDLSRPPIEFGFTRVIKLIRVPLFFCRLVRYLRSQQFDIVYATHFQTNAYLAFASLFSRGTRLVLGYRGSGRLNFVRRCINLLLVKMADRIIVNSKAEGEMLVNTTPTCLRKVRLVYNGVELRQEKDAGDDNEGFWSRLPANRQGVTIIGSVGRLHKVKGHEYLLRAFAALSKDYPDMLLLIVGDGQERRNLQDLALQLGIGSKVIFAGFCQTTREILDTMNIFVLPSLNESFPNALLEAMAAGLPCIATSVGGVREVIENGIDGLLVPPANVSMLENAIRSLLNGSDQHLNEIRERARRKASLFTKERMVKQVESVFEEALNVRGGRYGLRDSRENAAKS
jgi:glycosyltransferase involved in cell wall biosynthesis